ncbi:esterase [Spirochaetia bacterium]|nr:esterase [Spirochaetia bacterium]
MASAQMEQLKDIMKQMMEQGGMPKFDGVIDPAKLRATIEAAQKAMPAEPGVIFTPDTLGGVEAELCTGANARKDALIVYIHGGGLVCGNALTSRGYGSMLAGKTKIPVYTISYRLAPEHPFPAAVDDCFNAYADILKQYPGIPVFLIGESGGAYLCVTTTLKAKEAGLKVPAGIIPYSPALDLSGALDRSKNDGKDLIVTSSGLLQLRDMYCPDNSMWKNPLVSPIYGDYSGFPPMLLAWDDDETLAADSERLVELAKEAGVEVRYKSYPGCFHAFPTAGQGTPESAEILSDTLKFIREHI